MDKIRKDGDKYFPPESLSSQANIKSFATYQTMYKRSIKEPEQFWDDVAENYVWHKPWTKVREFNYDRSKGPISIKWFVDAETNICYNCVDRHLKNKADKTALIWEGNNPEESKIFSFKQLHAKVCQFANVLEKQGIRKGDRVAIYMPMVPELAFAVLACARIGAIHSVVFGGFSSQALADRILDSSCKMLITADGIFRGDKVVPLKQNADEAMQICVDQGHQLSSCIVVNRTHEKSNVSMQSGRDFWWDELAANEAENHSAVWMNSEDPLFILYTSGSTGKPKGVQHTTAGYMLYASTTFNYIFDHHDNDIYWCTADIGWITGHTYIIYGPLLNGATTVMFEGVPTWPDAGRFWQVVDKHNISVFYTAPTAIRAIAAQGDDFVKRHKRTSLRLLGTVGEPINPEAWRWYHKVVGEGRCPIVDTWWQTETGGVMITPIPGVTPTKPGSATLPFFGIQPAILDPETGKELSGEASGVLAMKASWPGQMRTVFGDHKRFEETYFSSYEGYYFTGDGCRRDQDGYYWITGRVDDVINVSGHRFGTAEIESALVSHPKVAEAAVIGVEHEIKGQAIYAFVTLNADNTYDNRYKKELVERVRNDIGPIATPDTIHWAPALPKTRSGKIMRRILRKIATNDLDNIGDTSTLADPEVVKTLLKYKP